MKLFQDLGRRFCRMEIPVKGDRGLQPFGFGEYECYAAANGVCPIDEVTLEELRKQPLDEDANKQAIGCGEEGWPYCLNLAAKLISDNPEFKHLHGGCEVEDNIVLNGRHRCCIQMKLAEKGYTIELMTGNGALVTVKLGETTKTSSTDQ